MYRVLGPLEIEVGSERILLPGARLRALLVALLVQPNTTVPVQRLLDAVWGEEAPHDPRNALHQVVRRLRAQLGPLGAAVETRPDGYRLAVEGSAIDAVRFESAYREARDLAASDPATAVTVLDGGLA